MCRTFANEAIAPSYTSNDFYFTSLENCITFLDKLNSCDAALIQKRGSTWAELSPSLDFGSIFLKDHLGFVAFGVRGHYSLQISLLSAS
jgi:hypothetical protein